MHSSAWMNGQYTQDGQPSKVINRLGHHLTNGKVASSSNSSQYTPMGTSVPQPQSAYFTSCNGAYSSGQTSSWQATKVPQQAVISQQLPTVGMYRNDFQWNSATSTNAQNGVLPLPTNLNYVPQVSTQQYFHQKSPQNLSNQNHMTQAIPSNQNQQFPMYGKQSAVMQDTYCAFDGLQHGRVQKTLCQNANGESVKPFPTYATSAASLQHVQSSCTSTPVSATTHSKRTAYNQNRSSGYRLSSTQPGFSQHTAPPIQMSFSQPVKNNCHSTAVNSSGHGLCKSNMGQKTKNYGRKATPYINPQSNPHSSQYDASNYFTTKSNGVPINAAAGTGQHMLNWQLSPGNADNLCRSRTASSDCSLQLNNNIILFESSQAVQPVASSLIESYNSNTSQSLIQALPKATHGAVSNLEAQPQHCSVPKGVYFTVTEEGSRNGFKADNIVFLGNNLDKTVLKRGLLGSLSQLHQSSERNTLQRNETQSSVASKAQMPVSSIKLNDHASHGHAVHKAVAVVQPLSQDFYQAAHKDAFSERINDQCDLTATDKFEKLFSTEFTQHNKSIYLTDGSNSLKEYGVHPEIANETKANACLNSGSGPSSGGTVMSSSESAETEDSSQNYADETESQLSNNMQSGKCITPTAQQSLTTQVPVIQNSEMNKGERPKDPKANVSQLSSVPIIPWTLDKLTMLIEECSKVQMQSEDVPIIDVATKLVSFFWENNTHLSMLSKVLYSKLVAEVEEFCSKHATSDSVILSHVMCRSDFELKGFHVLKHDYVHPKEPYTSSWCNINEHLDDIDKEFGFPWSSMYCLHNAVSDSQQNLIGPVNAIPAQIVSEMLNEALPQTEPEMVALDKEKQAAGVADTFTQPPLTNNTAIADSSGPYSFEIQVLPPVQAKLIFDQLQSEMLKSEKTDSRTEKFSNGPADVELLEITDVKLSEGRLEDRAESLLKEFCCFPRLKEIVWGSNKHSLSNCQCKQQPSPKDFTMKSLDEAERSVQKEKRCVITSDSEFSPVMEGTNKANAGKTMDNKTLIVRWPEQSTKIGEIIELTEDDKIPPLFIIMEPENISQPSIGSSPSDSEKQIENISSSESEITIRTSDLEEGCGHAQLKPKAPTESQLKTEHGKMHIGDESKQTLADKMDKVSFFVPSSLGQGSIHSPALKATFFHSSGGKRKRLESPDRFVPSLKKTKKCKAPVNPVLQPALEGIPEHMKVFVDPKDFEPNVRPVKLALFGSSLQRKCLSVGCTKSHMSSPENLSTQGSAPPETLTVNVNFWQRSPLDTVPPLKSSSKQRIHEEWRRSHVPTKITHGRKYFKRDMDLAAMSEVGFKKSKSVGNDAERRSFAGTKTNKRSLNWKRTSLNGLKLKIKKLKKGVVTPKRRADMRSKAEIGNHAAMPLQENNVLKFSVLPNTFNFKDGNESRDAVLCTPDHVDAKDKSSKITVKTPRGTWTAPPEMKYSTLPRADISSSLFQEFQKKYMEKTLPAMDE